MSNAYLQAVAPVKLQSTRKFVLFVLADMARDDGTSYASIAAICERTCLTDRAVQLCLTELENAGFLLREYRHGRSTFYTTRALELSLKTIDKHRRDGHDPVRLIECAIERGWTGIYPSDATLADGQQLGSATGRALVALQRMKGTGNVTQDFDAAWAQQPRLPAGMLPRDPRSEEEQLEAMIAGSLDPEATRALLHAESTEESQA